MKEKSKTKTGNSSIIKQLLPFIKKHIFLLALTLVCIFGEIALDIFFAQALKITSDATIGKDLSKLKNFLFIMLILLVANLVVRFLRTYSSGKFSEYCLYDIRVKTFKDIGSLPVPYLDNHPSGDLVSRVTSDLGLIQNFLQNTLGDFIATPVRVISSAIFIIIINWKLTIFSLICTPLFLFISMKVNAPVQKHTKKQQEELGKVNSLAQDSISGLTVAKSFTLEDRLEKKFSEAVDKSVASGLKAAFYTAITQPLGACLGFLPFVLIFAFGGFLGVKGQLTFGALLAFIQMMNSVVNPLNNIPNLLNSMRSASAGTQRIAEVWDEAKERDNGQSFGESDANAIRFENVHFGYESSKQIANGLSFNIREGEKVALVGHSGCGKSTILKLISGFYPLNKGSIQLYGHSLEDWKLPAARALAALVSQDNYLFPESIYTNILYGRPDATKEEVEAAAATANIKSFIESLPERYDTMAGERGVKLSGGQKQRIAIARAILKNTPILLLDEATSALDVESEKEVQKALEGLLAGKTALIIAHRLSTIRNVDRILVMNEGKIVEEGTHEELMTGGTLYSQLYAQQFAEEVDAVV